MVLQEFVYDKKKAEKALERLNEKKIKNGDGLEEVYTECECPYGDISPEDCEDLCRLNHK